MRKDLMKIKDKKNKRDLYSIWEIKHKFWRVFREIIK